MISRNHHFEIVARQGNRWTILHVVHHRLEALDLAKRAWMTQKYDAVSATSETFRPETRDFTSIEIFNRGNLQRATKTAERVPVQQCLSYDNLYEREGRMTIWAVLHRTLSDWKITPSELLHSMQHYLKLYNTGMVLRDAIQRTAVSLEGDTENESIQARVRKLDKLVDGCVSNLKRYRGKAPKLYPGGMAKVAGELSQKSDRSFRLSLALTDYLYDAVSLEDKMGRTAAFLSDNRPPWVLAVLDQFLAEIFLNQKLMPLLVQGEGRHVDYMNAITLFALGKLDEFAAAQNKSIDEFGGTGFDIHEEMLRINALLVQGKLPETSRVLEKHVIAETRSTKKIIDGSILEQLSELDRFAKLIATYDMPASMREAITENTQERASRLVNSQSVAELLDDIPDPVDRVYRLLDLHDVTTGASNRRTVANFIMPILSRPEYETRLMAIGGQRFEMMKTLTSLQARVISMDISELQRRKIAERLDYFCRTIFEKSQILEKIARIDASEATRVSKALSLLADGFLTDGDCRARAEDFARVYLRKPSFMTDLINDAPADQKTKVLLDFRKLMTRAGLGKASEGGNRSKEVATDAAMAMREQAASPEGKDPKGNGPKGNGGIAITSEPSSEQLVEEQSAVPEIAAAGP